MVHIKKILKKKKRIYLADSNEQGILCATYIIFNWILNNLFQVTQ